MQKHKMLFKKIKVGIIILGLIFSYSSVQAQPEISSNNNSLVHNEPFTILGSNFGTKSTATPVAWDNLEDGSCSRTATVGSWTSVHDLTINSSSPQRHSNSSYNATHNITSECYPFFTGGSDSSRWFVQYWFYLDNDFAFASSNTALLGNIKMFRMWSTTSDSSNFKVNTAGTWDILLNDEVCDSNHSWPPYEGGSTPEACNICWENFENDIDTGSWHLFEFEYKDSSGSGVADGEFTWWFDGTQIVTDNDLITKCGGGGSNNSRPLVVGFYVSTGTGGDGNNHFYIDDAYIDNTWARVMIGNNATFANCTHREIQIPTNWDNNSITFTVNQGAFQDGDNAYLFVVDADGNVNANGYPIVIGGGGGDSFPSVNISSPTSATTYATSQDTIAISGTASDDDAILSITWSNDRGGNGPAINGSGDWTSWSVENIALLEGDNVITVMVTDSADQTSSDTITVTFGGERGDSPASVNISSPTSATTYATSQDTIAISGNASDDVGISIITWSNDRGGNGPANNNSGDWTSWSIENIALQEGDNVITVTATDSADQTSSDTITVTSSDIVQVWSATAQTGDSAFKESVVTYCVRLLIEGDHVTQSGSTVRLGFQGRSSGGYTIRKVSVAERDMGGAEGNVIDSTWTRVTFDGNSEVTWASDVMTVAAGAEKLSDPISFSLQAGKDYYITFKIDTPSLYLNPPAFYRELYFLSADHTEDIDWSGNGHIITQDYHALSKIYIKSGGEIPSMPTGLTVAVNE